MTSFNFEIETPFAKMSEAEIELDLLKAALTSPDLFATIKNVFHNHPHPEALDSTGRALYRIFQRLEVHQDG